MVRLALALFLSVLLTGCKEASSDWITLHFDLEDLAPRAAFEDFSERTTIPPASYRDFGCYFLSISGDAIPNSIPDTLPNSISSSCLNLGATSGLVDVSKLDNTATMQVLSGKQRTVKLMAVAAEGTIGDCRSHLTVESVLKAATKPKIYELGRLVVDLTEDGQLVEIPNSYLGTPSIDTVQSCSGGTASNSIVMTPALAYFGDTDAVQVNGTTLPHWSITDHADGLKLPPYSTFSNSLMTLIADASTLVNATRGVLLDPTAGTINAYFARLDLLYLTDGIDLSSYSTLTVTGNVLSGTNLAIDWKCDSVKLDLTATSNGASSKIYGRSKWFTVADSLNSTPISKSFTGTLADFGQSYTVSGSSSSYIHISIRSKDSGQASECSLLKITEEFKITLTK